MFSSPLNDCEEAEIGFTGVILHLYTLMMNSWLFLFVYTDDQFSCCRYYNGEKKAPILTIFIGGNHEASNYLQELTYGGWVAPNIYFLGKQ